MNQINAATTKKAKAQLSKDTVQGELCFIIPQDEKPYFESSRMTGGVPEIFFESEQRKMPIHDMRMIADDLDIDREGFELIRHTTHVADLYDDDAIETEYNREIESLLKQRFGANKVVIFDAERLFATGARVIQVNVWRPINGPVQRAPLAVVDSASLQPDDLVATDQVFPDRVGEIYHLAYSPLQRWYFVPEMRDNEVLLLKGWDSLDDGRTRFNAHGAFELDDTDKNTPPRESIELRTLVIIG